LKAIGDRKTHLALDLILVDLREVVFRELKRDRQQDE
jgi:hypothetical protein